MSTETPWIPAPPGVITGDFRQNLLLIRRAAHAEDSEDVIIHVFQVLGHDAALVWSSFALVLSHARRLDTLAAFATLDCASELV